MKVHDPQFDQAALGEQLLQCLGPQRRWDPVGVAYPVGSR
jgi:hypothetical protein